MHCIHKTFCTKRTVFLCVFLLFSVIQSAQATNPIFTVEGVKVDVTAKSAVEAREKAFEQAQVDAFKILAQRMLSDAEAAAFQTPDVGVISSLMQDYEVNNEQLSSVRYKADYIIRFQDNAVKKFFSNSNAAYTDVTAQPALVLPFYRDGGQTLLWSPYNVWMKAWNRTNDLKGLVPLVVPLGDLSDVQDIGDDDALDYHASKLNRLLARYEASEAIILIAEPNDQLARIQGESDAAVGNMSVSIYRTDRGQPEFVQSVNVTAGASDSLGNFMDKGVKQVMSALRQDWKTRTAVNPAQSNQMVVRVQYNSLKEWADTRRALARVSGVNRIDIKSITPKQAVLGLSYGGDERRLALALQQMNMELTAPQGQQSGSDAMSYYSNGGRSASAPMYDLTFRRYR